MKNNKLKFLVTFLLLSTFLVLSSCSNKSNTSTSISDDEDEVFVEQKDLDRDVIDSLFKELVLIAEDVAEDADVEKIKSYKLAELSDGFEAYLETGDLKANVGFIVSEVSSLNSSETMAKMVDSLDAYLNSEDESTAIYKVSSKNIMASSYESGGINNLSTALLASSPQILAKEASSTSYPEFMTISYIQNVILDEINPKLDRVINALEKLELKGIDQSVLIDIMDEQWELDMADIYLVDGSLHALRGSLLLLTAYNFDLYDPTTKTYSWIDTLVEFSDMNCSSYSNDKYIYRSVGDTLIKEYYSALYCENEPKYIYNFLKYNMERPEFLTLINENHAKSYEDLQAVPEKLKKAIELLEAETDSQENDIIKKVDFDELTSDFAEIEEDMIAEGVSAELAAKFKTPTAMLNFVEELLTKPYHFKETFEDGQVDMTVDISKFFTNPIQDLRTLLPKYKFRNVSDIFSVDLDYSYSYQKNTLSLNLYSSNIYEFDIDESLIATDTMFASTRYITFDTPFAYYKEMDYYENLNVFDFVDDSNNIISIDDADDNLENGIFLYFDDYTFNGIFPDMTREKWNDFVKNNY